MALSKQLQRIHEAIMTIKQYGGVFGRNPTFNDVTIEGQLTFDGDIDINSDLKVSGDIETTGNVIIATSGKGIDFSATAGPNPPASGTSELLDDYEEGTFTPVLADATSGGNEASVLSAYGYYTKVGRVVTVTISITNPNTTGLTATNNVYITGLPFSAFSLAGGIYYTAPLAGGGNFATAGTYLGSVGDNLSYMTILKADFGGSTTFQKVSAINTGVTDIVTSLSYFA
ncbi:polymer-forming cytoskeletal protein [Planktomarina sp.]|uniref:polymer-forming cytoskeletal protein n=1 Tax=Planktomarina sp. TaxID=2024851 RepID=UPI0032607A94